jgi:flagellar FliL protein
MNIKNKLMMAGLVLVAAAGTAGATWHLTASAAETPVKDQTPAKYVTLDNVIVMLRRAPNEGRAHYLSANLVVATSEEKAKEAKDQLPLLRSVAVTELSTLTMTEATGLTVPELTAQLNKAFDARYDKDGLAKPFSTVMLGKLIVE